jgi:hypothetical protein
MYHLLLAEKLEEASVFQSNVIWYVKDRDLVGESLPNGREVYTPRIAWVQSWTETLLEWSKNAEDHLIDKGVTGLRFLSSGKEFKVYDTNNITLLDNNESSRKVVSDGSLALRVYRVTNKFLIEWQPKDWVKVGILPPVDVEKDQK